MNLYDVVIIGAGINGICIAENLNENYKICIIETGNLTDPSNLSDYKITGHPEGIRTINDYKFGGGHNVWHGLLARLDYDEAGNGEWGESAENMKKYYDLAENYLGLDNEKKKNNEKQILSDLMVSGLNIIKHKIFHQVRVNFDKKRKLEELKKKNINILFNSTVVNIDRNDEDCYKVNCTNNNSILTKNIILASNAVYNAIILKNSKNIVNSDLIGKNLSDHPMGVIGKIKFKSSHKFPICLIRKKYNAYYSKVGFMVNDPDLNLVHTFYLVPTIEGIFSGKDQSIRKSMLMVRDSGLSLKLIIQLLKNIKMIFFVIAYKFGIMFSTKYIDILVVSEQNLSSNNFVNLDEMGLVVKNWTIDDKLIDSIKKSAKTLARIIDDIYQIEDLDIISNHKMRAELTSAAHLCCTTRMSTSDNPGVVNSNFELIGLKNIYVAGASVFPRAMSLNNTLTAVALSFKLINNLNSKLGKS